MADDNPNQPSNSNVDPIEDRSHHNDPQGTPELDESKTQQQPGREAGETVDLSADEDVDMTPRSNVELKPEVQEALDQYYAEREQQDQDQDQGQEPTQQADSGGGTQARPQTADSDNYSDSNSDSNSDTTTTQQPPDQGQVRASNQSEPEPSESSGQEPNPNPESREPTAEPDGDEPDSDSGSMMDQIDADDIGEEVNLEDIDLDELENQEWRLGERREPRLITVKGMKFLLHEPEDDDRVSNSIQRARQGDGIMSMFRRFADIVVKAPTITDERWENQMTTTERMSLGTQCMMYLQAEDF